MFHKSLLALRLPSSVRHVREAKARPNIMLTKMVIIGSKPRRTAMYKAMSMSRLVPRGSTTREAVDEYRSG